MEEGACNSRTGKETHACRASVFTAEVALHFRSKRFREATPSLRRDPYRFCLSLITRTGCVRRACTSVTPGLSISSRRGFRVPTLCLLLLPPSARDAYPIDLFREVKRNYRKNRAFFIPAFSIFSTFLESILCHAAAPAWREFLFDFFAPLLRPSPPFFLFPPSPSFLSA